MEIKNNSIIHTVRDYALAKFKVELSDEQISADLKGLNFSSTLQLTTALQNEDDELFSKYITLDLDEGYTVLPPMDRERYQEREGLEGPFPLRSGKVVYYDPKEGMYYDPDTDYYMSYEEYAQHDKDPRMQEAQSPGVVAQLQDKGYGDDSEEEQIEERKVAGAPGGNAGGGGDIVPTASRTQEDPNHAKQAAANADASDANAAAVDDNASEIKRILKLAGIE
jgi:hypothetical protein